MAVAVDTNRIRQDIQQFAFVPLFIEELGWDMLRMPPLSVTLASETYTLQAVAQKRGFQVFACDPDSRGGIPDYVTRKQIDAKVTPLAREHLIIYADRNHVQQVWQWTRREQGKPSRTREQHFLAGQSGEKLTQRLRDIAFDIEEEETLSLLDVTARIKSSFDVDRTTKKFYDRFKTEHDAFLTAIDGLADKEQCEWYASLTLNRLMFVYFIQRQGFLDGDGHYLRHRLEMVQAQYGEGRFHSFFRQFLLRLFHEGLGTSKSSRPSDFAEIFGDVPYVNGGLFEEHQIEHANRQIAIPDKAFKDVFDFFDAYDWHLDDSPLGNDREINPDVLGYIFEKYINQRQMGAYYTKEDITGYINRNTIIPWLFESASKDCSIAFEPGGEVWRLLSDDPDRYLYEAVSKGIDEPLPEEIAAGVSNISRRDNWNRSATEPFALPTETWREHVARRRRALELRQKLAAGEIHEINDLITYNLDIERFAQDVIERCEGPELLRAFWRALTTITVLDPTCGSGAFLFAALNILETLYQAALDRMRAFVSDYERLGRLEHGEAFRNILVEVSTHPNSRYFILKSIIVRNLYGVDIMEEACEIAKLRLFLKLVAQVNDPSHIEPLPDIDFNIRAGNTLVGFATLDAVRDAMTLDASGRIRKLLLDTEDEATLVRINERAESAGRAFGRFQQMQSEPDRNAGDLHDAKRDLQQQLDVLRGELDRYLAREYDVNPDDLFAFGPWRKSHQPFHWFVEFYAIVQQRGGFNVILGNPPYVERAKVTDYDVVDNQFLTKSCGNLYAAICERSYRLLGSSGQFGMIVPISCVATPRMQPLRELWKQSNLSSHISHYSGDAHPSVLFQGVKFRLSILLQRKNTHPPVTYSTHFQRWLPDGRDALFQLISYTIVEPGFVRGGLVPKVASDVHAHILRKLTTSTAHLEYGIQQVSSRNVYAHRIVAHFVKAFDFIPFFKSERDGEKRSEDYKIFSVDSASECTALVSLLNSSLFYSWFVAYSDVYHCGREIILDFPTDLAQLAQVRAPMLTEVVDRLMDSLREHSIRRRIPYKATGIVEYDEFYPRLSKSIIDEIDRVLARYYGFTDEELDFIINYDIKFRMGQENGIEDEEDE